MELTRRSLLAGMGAGTTAAIAGCLGDTDADGYTAFFALHDFAEHVVGDELDLENPVGTGRMGHGWSPGSDLSTNVANAGLFIYLDTPEFSWAQDLVSTLESDYGDDEIHIIEALDGLEPYFLSFAGDDEDEEGMPSPDYGHDFEHDQLGFDDFDIYDMREGDYLGYWHNDHWHGPFPDVPLDSHVPIGVVIEDTDGHVLPLGDSYRVDARVAEDADDIVEIESRGDHIEVHGLETGESGIVFEIYHDDELVSDTAEHPHEFEVTEDAEHDVDLFDPHLWVDPVRSQRMVENIADGLAEYDPENEEVYRDNAAEYNDELESIHRELDSLVSGAELGVAVFAGHDSFQYLEQRYGFDLVTPVGVTPDAAETIDDISGLIDVIEEHDIDTVLYDPFESPDPGEEYPQMVELLFDETDIDDAVPLTPLEGVTEEWDDEGWGWIEQMENVNIPALRQALKAE